MMTFDQLVEYLRQGDNFLIVSHADPDGDAVGSQVGLLSILRSLGKSAYILNSDACPLKLRVFDPDGDLHSLEDGDPVPVDIDQRSVILIDTSDFNHTSRAHAEILSRANEVVIIDHHTAPSVLPCRSYIDDTAAASSQIVFQLAEAFDIPLERETANALFMGIVFDTGSFIYPKTTPETFRAAQKLVEAGVKPKEIHSALYETIEPSKMRLTSRIQGTMCLHHNDRTACQILTQEMLLETGASVEDSENVINYPLKCSTVQVSLLIKEVEPGFFRCSLRSKGIVDVSVLALAHGGGGHKTAAGFPCPRLPLADLETVLLQSVLDLYPKD